MQPFWTSIKSRFALLFAEASRVTSFAVIGIFFLLLVLIAQVPEPWDMISVITLFSIGFILLVRWVLKGWKQKSLAEEKKNQNHTI